jgi:flagellar basal-body rod modification protein FlgD
MSTISQLPTASDPAKAAMITGLPGFDRKVKKTLDQGDFLKLLTTQLANQDPLSPQSDLNSIGQMASFTSAQQMGDLVTSLKSFMANQDFMNAQSLLGKYVTVSKDKTQTFGVVTAIGHDENGAATITIGNNSKLTFAPSNVTAVQDVPSAENRTAGALSSNTTDGS